MRTSEIRHQIALLERERESVKAKSVAAITASDEKALSKLDRRAAEIDRRIEIYRVALSDAEAREEDERRQRRVAMTQAAGAEILRTATEQLPTAIEEVQETIAQLAEKLAKVHELRDRMMTCASMALEYSRTGASGIDVAVMNEVSLTALTDPFIRSLERAGLGNKGIVCSTGIHLAPVGPTFGLHDATQLLIDRIAVRVADLGRQAERSVQREPSDPRISRDPNEKSTEV